HGQLPAQHREACYFCPSAVSNKQRIFANIERRLNIEFATPSADRTDALKMLVKLVRYQTKHVRKFAVADFIFEVRNDDMAEVAHSTACFSPIRRSRPG